MATDYNLLGSTEVLEELQEGRTRELLMLLQDKPVPEVQDPINETSESGVKIVDGDYELGDKKKINPTIATFEDSDVNPKNSNWGNWTGNTSNLSIVSGTELSGNQLTLYNNQDNNTKTVTSTRDSPISPTTLGLKYAVSGTPPSNRTVSFVWQNSGERLIRYRVNDGGSLRVNSTDTGVQDYQHMILIAKIDWESRTFRQYVIDANDQYRSVLSDTTHDLDGTSNSLNQMKMRTETTENIYVDKIGDEALGKLNGHIQGKFVSPTTEPADFKQWNAIQARDVSEGGSTSTEPVEFEIGDSSGSEIHSSRIPKSRIADEPFTMRDRIYSESAGSNGQSNYTIATTGDGGHFGIPVLTVVSVKKNGSVLDSANWSFDDTDTVTIDTSSVTIASGDTIEIKYDFDVFDSTLQPRAYLSREDTSEDSPSISHFRYEYVI